MEFTFILGWMVMIVGALLAINSLRSTEVGKTEWKYDKIMMIADTKGYLVFIYSANHAQVHDKSSIQGGTAEEFCKFIEEKTGKKVVKI